MKRELGIWVTAILILSVVGTFQAAGNGGGDVVILRDDDGSMEDSISLDYGDDAAKKF
mgnify:CR=1 FL=1